MSLYADTIDGDALLLEIPDKIGHGRRFSSGPFDVEVIDLKDNVRFVELVDINMTYVKLCTWICVPGCSEGCRNVGSSSGLEENRLPKTTIVIEWFWDCISALKIEEKNLSPEPLITSQLSVHHGGDRSMIHKRRRNTR